MFYLEPMQITFLILTTFIFVQGVLFGANFVFRDGTNGEPDLDSFSKSKLEQELQEISDQFPEFKKPLILLGAKLDTDIPKQNSLLKFMEENQYRLVYSNDLFYLYASAFPKR